MTCWLQNAGKLRHTVADPGGQGTAYEVGLTGRLSGLVVVRLVVSRCGGQPQDFLLTTDHPPWTLRAATWLALLCRLLAMAPGLV